MKKYIYISIAFLALLGFIGWQSQQLKKIKADRDVYKGNTNVLLKDVERYKTKDSLNVVSLGNLELKIEEYKKYRNDDFKLIESLKIDKKRLESIVTANTETIYKLQGTVRDSIIYRDNFIVDTLRCVAIHDKWFDFNGCVNRQNEFTGAFENRDSLLYVEHIVPKRFWFIKWGVKERRQEIISRNPHTEIVGAEFITIRK